MKIAKNAKPTHGVLCWLGGKWKMAPWIIKNLPAHRVYVEPFGGAASVLLRKERCEVEVYNDLDQEIVNLFRVLRERGAELEQTLRLTPFSRDEFNYSRETSSDPLEKARRTVVRSYMGFGSNSHNRNTGFQKCTKNSVNHAQLWKNYPDSMDAIIERLRGVVIENLDALKVIKDHDSHETLHYIDPPYVISTRTAGNNYRHELTDSDHENLAELLHDVKGKVALSGYISPLYDKLYKDWKRIDRETFALGARKRTESLWLNPAALRTQKQQAFF